jgi:hypothetical protein
VQIFWRLIKFDERERRIKHRALFRRALKFHKYLHYRECERERPYGRIHKVCSHTHIRFD